MARWGEVEIFAAGAQTRDRTVTVRRNGRRVRVPLYEATRPCVGSWQSANIFTYQGGELLTATDTQPC